MLIGFNYTLGDTAPLVRNLIETGRIDYVELLIDNFLSVPAEDVATAFDAPLAFHIMLSKFIERDFRELDNLAGRLRKLIDLIKPIYVSDHVARFSHAGRQLYHLAEVDYVADYEQIRQRVDRWQQALGCQILLENYPSIMDGGHDAPRFHERLYRDTGAGVLFDVSNAVCAHLNCGLPLDAWSGVIDISRHFHIGGYNLSILPPHAILDTHDQALSQVTLDFLARHGARMNTLGATLTYERDDDFDEAAIDADLQRLRAAFPPAPRTARAMPHAQPL